MSHELAVKWVDQDRFAAFELDRVELKRSIAPGELVPYRIFLTRLYELYAHTHGKAVIGTEIPGHVRMLPTLQHSWPGVKFVHLIQDGRDACFSLFNDSTADLAKAKRYPTWREDPLLTLALWWRKRVLQAQRTARQLESDRYYELRYEDLLLRPFQECAKLSAFLDVPCEEEIESSCRERGLGAVGFSREWRSQLPPERLECFEAAAGDLLDEFGYRRVFPHPRDEIVRYATRLQHAFSLAQPELDATASERLSVRRESLNRSNPFVFIVGCPRSGTTLLQRVLDAHPDIAVPSETFWIPYFFQKRIGVDEEGMVTAELVSRLFEYYKFYRMKLAKDELLALISNGPISYATFVTGVFDLYGAVRRKPLAGDKTPDYVRSIPILHQLWPSAKFVHVIRDGRDVCLSAINWKRKVARLAELYAPWRSHPVVTAALWWEWHVRQGIDRGSELGPKHYYEVRYEALVEDPAGQCAKLCEFLGVAYDAAMLLFNEGRTKNEWSRDAKNDWLPIVPGLRDWSKQMPPDDIERFEAAAGRLLEELGYRRQFASPGREVVEHVRQVRSQFDESVATLTDWLP
jgi:hypothetical protein